MNNQTLEQAAKEHSQNVWGEYRYDIFKHDDIITDKSLGEITQTDFIAGANYQKEQDEAKYKELLDSHNELLNICQRLQGLCSKTEKELINKAKNITNEN